MVWTWVVVAVIAIGLPLAACRLSRNLKPPAQPIGGLGPPTDSVDRWLIERHPLPAVQRWQVRQAVLYGRMVKDPALKEAAHDLAGSALSGEVKLGSSVRVLGWIALVEAAALVAIGVFIFVDLASPAGIVPVLLGVWNAVKGVIVLRAIRQGPERAYVLNR
jgi:hypothetical protein